ncbi:MAG: ImmA/IrrE family metallo-endopeptidase [Chloracidobacterium sp.]|nr:ImmA/IrrE family metallo-endopeptidase [Chloracidobacterium sp.]
MTSFEGLLICRKDRSKGAIAVSTAIQEEGRRLFTVCHEVGHYVLPGHGASECRSNEIESWGGRSSQKEIDANRFASELLLPTRILYPIVVKKKATIALAKSVSKDFNTSLTAAAYKIVCLTEEACVLVWSADCRVTWFKRNDNFWGFLESGALDEQSLAFKLMKSGEREAEGRVFAECWLQGDGLSGKNKLWEDSIFLPSYNAVLTILTADN